MDLGLNGVHVLITGHLCAISVYLSLSLENL